MAIFEVPLRASVADQDLQVPLDGRVYTLRLRWAGREERWYMDVSDEDRVMIYAGIALVLNFPLGIRCASDRIFPGVLMASDTSGANAEPALADLGDRVKLYYFDEDSLPIDADATVVS